MCVCVCLHVPPQAETAAVEKLAQLLPCQDPELLSTSLRLLLNLSFDASLRAQMVQAGLVPKLSSLLGKQSVTVCVCCVSLVVYLCGLRLQVQLLTALQRDIVALCHPQRGGASVTGRLKPLQGRLG